MAHYPQNDFIPDINSCFDAISECLTTWATVMSLAQVIHTSGKTENVFDAVEMAVMVGAVDVANDTISDFLKKYRAYPVMKPGGSIGMPMPGEELNHPGPPLNEESLLATEFMPCVLWDLKPGSPD